MKKHARIKNTALLLSATVGLSLFADVTIGTDTTLLADADYSGQTVTVSANTTLNLNGHKLTASGISGGGTIISAKFDEGVYATTGDTLLDGLTTQNSLNYGYVDTDYKPSATDRVETKITFGSTTTGTWWIFGSSDDSRGRFDLYISGDFKLELDSGAKATFSTPTANSSYEIVADGAKGFATISKDGAASTAYYWDAVSFTPSRNISLLNQKVFSSNRGARGLTMHYFRVYDSDGNLKVNMLPVKRPDGTLCFYDTVRKSYHAYAWPSDQTEPTLTEGSDISYYALDYAKTPTTFARDYVQTSYTPSWADHVRMKTKLGNCSETQWILACQTGNASSRFCFYRSGGVILCIGAEHKLGAYVNGDEYEFDANGNAGTAKVWKNGLTLTNITWTAKSFTPNQPYMLFNQSSRSTRAMPDCTLYYLNVADTNGYERLNLIPAKKKDGTVGFYDSVRNEFLTPANDTSLVGGAELPRDLTSPDGTCAYKASNSKTMTSGIVQNLFTNNFHYASTPTNRVCFNTPMAFPVRFDYDFGEGNEKTVNAYKVYAGDNSQFCGKWTFYGSNDAMAWTADSDDGWTVLDATDGELATPAAPGQCYTRAFQNAAVYRYYRLKVETERTSGWASLTQLEYFNISATATPGELHVNVPSGGEATCENMSLGGDMKVVAEVDGTLTTSITNRFYTGGTEVVSNGVYCLAAPMAIPALSFSADTTLGFLFANKTTAPMLTLDSAASLPSPLKAGIYRADGETFKLPGNGLKITSGYDFSGKVISYTATDWARRILVGDASGNLWVYGPSGLIIMFR